MLWRSSVRQASHLKTVQEKRREEKRREEKGREGKGREEKRREEQVRSYISVANVCSNKIT